ncbi:hypothetical protein KII95_08630 [Leuconostoc gelidum subsp. aenigmaticum]|uniref:hypothetical protein n=1 Tax=Leuconostoc gelidum TaxID=1244 RepID=UPI001CC63AC8|nr:hypothetical protein [Leuconostoc gelidum]MBZ6004073.1 hypothetical protein [Leuconostoc gelidum subsp. aenigmaticum]
MDKWVSDFVKTAVTVKVLSLVSNKHDKSGYKFKQADVEELGTRLKVNGGLREMMNYIATHAEFSINSVFESSAVAVETFQKMRAEKNA